MSTARHILPDDITARIRDGERVELPDEGAAVVPLADLRLLEEIEDAADLAAVEAAVAEGGEPVPWETLKAEMNAEK